MVTLNRNKVVTLNCKKVVNITEFYNKSLKEELQKNKVLSELKKEELIETEKKLLLLEEKWIKSEIAKDTYDRWYANYKYSIENAKESIQRFSTNPSGAFKILQKNLDLLTDISSVYTKANTLEKREFVNLVFDSNLYYEEGIYRTPTMLHVFTCNQLKMKNKGLLIYEKKRDDFSIIPSSGVAGNRTRVQTSN